MVQTLMAAGADVSAKTNVSDGTDSPFSISYSVQWCCIIWEGVAHPHLFSFPLAHTGWTHPSPRG